MKKIIVPFTLLLLAFCANAQKSQVIYAEHLSYKLGGYSLNYDSRLRNGENSGLGYRVGLGIRSSDKSIAVPILVNYIQGEKHALEVGIGLYNSVITTTTQRRIVSTPTLNVMYRFQGDNGLNIRLGWSPVFFKDLPIVNTNYYFSSRLYWLTPGISLGWKFSKATDNE